MPIGKKGKVTQAEKNIVYKIGEQSAYDYFKYYLGDDIGIEDMPPAEYPLAFFEDDGGNFYLRALQSFNKEKGYLTLSTNIPEGATVQITHTTRDKIIEAAKKSVNSAITEYPGSRPSVAVIFTCCMRKHVLGTRVVEECQILKTNFPDLPVAGFYTYGEIGPLHKGKPTRFHNETFLSLLLGTE
jgi:hypothetical protein